MDKDMDMEVGCNSKVLVGKHKDLDGNGNDVQRFQ